MLMFILGFIQVLESTIHVTATIDKSCNERLDVEKTFPSLVSFFFIEAVTTLANNNWTLF